MAVIICDLDEETVSVLKARAVRNGRSIEAEVHDILHKAAAEERRNFGLGTAIASRFRDCGFQEGDIQEFRGFTIRPATFDEDI